MWKTGSSVAERKLRLEGAEFGQESPDNCSDGRYEQLPELHGNSEINTYIPPRVFISYMQFCDECGSMMHTEGDSWVCRSCANETPRDSQPESAMATRDGQRDDGAPAVADATQNSTETMQAPCPAEDCTSDRAYYEMMPKPGGSYEVRLFTCVECGHKWRES